MHPSREVLSALASGELAAKDRADVLVHVAQCDSCREFLALIAPEEGPPTAVARTTTRK
jgi:anti-sigma factor ChrR (cupin superfamily)